MGRGVLGGTEIGPPTTYVWWS